MTLDQRQALTNLFKQVGDAHHHAFADVNGDDPDWPEWYATYLIEKIPAVIGRDLPKADLEDLLRQAHQSYERITPNIPWQEFYAEFFIETT